MPVSAEAEASVRDRLAACGIDPVAHRLIVVHVSAGNPFRRWPAEAFVDLLTRAGSADARRRIVVVSGPSERDAARAIGARARAAHERRRRAIIDDVEVDLGNCGRCSNVPRCSSAATAGRCTSPGRQRVPIVGLYGPTLSVRSAPWRPARFVTESVELATCPAARATSGRARRATSAAWRGSRPNGWPRRPSARCGEREHSRRGLCARGAGPPGLQGRE